jgi:CHAT domain-containing protein/tetratricopeptide (TPR) repeat protein
MLKPRLVLVVVLSLGAGLTWAEEPPFKRLLTGDDAKNATELEKRIALLREQAKFAEAVEPASELLALREGKQVKDHWQTIDARLSLGWLRHMASLPADAQKELAAGDTLETEAEQLRQQGKAGQAEPLLRKALVLRQKHLGEEHYLTAESQADLAENLDAQAKYADAEALFQKALAVLRKTRGEEHPGTLTCSNNLATLYYHQGRYPDAEALQRKILASRLRVLGEAHSDTGYSYGSLAEILHVQGKNREAEPRFRQSLAVFEKTLGKEDPTTLIVSNNLAMLLQEQGKFTEAEVLHRQVLAVRLRTLGEEHSDTAVSYGNLAVNLQDQGKLTDAEPLYRKALAICRKALGEEHPGTLTCANNLATLYYHQGKLADSEALYRWVFDVRRRTLGEEHHHTAVSRANLANILRIGGKYREAERLFRAALATFKNTVGEDHPNALIAANNLALLLDAEGNRDETVTLRRRVVEIRQKLHGKEHPDLAIPLGNLAWSLHAQGRHDEAAELFQQALTVARNALGEEHPDTVRVHDALARSLYARGKYRDAERHWRAAAAGFEAARLLSNTTGLERAAFAARTSPLADLTACLARLGEARGAWEFGESNLARGLLDDLTAGKDRSPASGERQKRQERRDRLEQFNRQILSLVTARERGAADQERLEQLTGERASLYADLARESAELARKEVYSLEAVQKQLPAEGALVFWVDRNAPVGAVDPSGEHWACVVRPSGPPLWQKLPGTGPEDAWTRNDDELPQQVRQALLRPAARQADREQFSRKLLAQRLLPLEPRLKAAGGLPAASRLIVVPAGPMAGVPVEALTERYTISYAPSGTVLARLLEKHRPFRPTSLLAVGDPVFLEPAKEEKKEEQADLPDHGVMLSQVLEDGAAGRAGVRSGDVLQNYAGQKVGSRADLAALLGKQPREARVPLGVWRDGKGLDFTVPAGPLGVQVSDRPAAEAVQSRRELAVLLARSRGLSHKPLPGTRKEVTAIARLFPRAELLLGSDASEQKLDDLLADGRLATFHVLHFATHGDLDPTAASRSALVLAEDDLPDPVRQARLGRKVYTGRLTVQTIRDTWKLDADLVTLSACETALGPEGGGEGLLGFTQALFERGARSLVLSLWKVDDTATALLMDRFYENLLGKREGLKAPLGRAEALTEAKQWLRALPRQEAESLAVALDRGELRGSVSPLKPLAELPKEAIGQKGDKPFAHPYYWAAFILLGDPD